MTFAEGKGGHFRSRRPHGAPRYNKPWHHAVVETPDKDAAKADLRRRSARLTAALTEVEAARKDLAAGIVQYLEGRVLSPAEVTAEVPYDRVHVGRIAREGGVPPLREATVVAKKRPGRRRRED
jgi:hypothetical protein